jgi:hypothetical protein
VLDDDAKLLPPEKIQGLIATVRRLLALGEALLAWSVAEASLRHLAEKQAVTSTARN